MKVSAIVSTFNSASFLQGCLQDLINQSLYKVGNLEIVVIDSGSTQEEKAIVESFQKEWDFIKYFRTENKESLYMAWNRGISLAEGQYLTNANTDDRHDCNCLEKLSNTLDEDRDIGLVYGKIKKVFSVNDEEKTMDGVACDSQHFFPGSLFLHYPYGAQPMWRANLHSQFGAFNPDYQAIGDYEFAIRLLFGGVKAKYVPQAKGNMLWHQGALSTQGNLALTEKKVLTASLRNVDFINKVYNHCRPNNFGKQGNRYTEYLLDLSIRSLCHYPQFSEGKPTFNLEFHQFLSSQETKDFRMINNQALVDSIMGKKVSPKFLARASEKKCQITDHNLKVLQSGLNSDPFILFGSRISFPTEMELKGVKSGYLQKWGPEMEDNLLESSLFYFDNKVFNETYLEGINLQKLLQYSNVFIWGINEKAKWLMGILGKQNNLSVFLLDSSEENVQGSKFRVYHPQVFLGKKDMDRNAFILCMSSIHRKSVIDQIGQIQPNSRIFHI
ncbi:MAG: glycosyltransferase [Opitutales bacterium]|nr:glycosyltransferase [Opitutales bacterium]